MKFTIRYILPVNLSFVQRESKELIQPIILYYNISKVNISLPFELWPKSAIATLEC